MSRSQPWQIETGDRLFVAGKTGSGKTAATNHLVTEQMDHLVFMDIKGSEHKNLNLPVLGSLDDVHTALFADNPDDRLDRFVFRPRKPTLDVFDETARLVYEKGNTHLVADELKSVYHGAGLTEHHNLLLTNGRSRGAGSTSTTQRPKRIPVEAISEAEHVFAFKLKTGTDRDRIREVLGDRVKARGLEHDLDDVLRDMDPWYFVYDHDRLDMPKLCSPLDL